MKFANDNYGILYERMITDLKSEIKFLRDQVASKETYFHEEISFYFNNLKLPYPRKKIPIHIFFLQENHFFYLNLNFLSIMLEIS